MKRISFIIVFLLLYPVICFSETITFKDGKIINADILERTDKYVKVEISGLLATYYIDEIASFGDDIVSEEKPGPGTSLAQEVLRFSDAKQIVDAFVISMEAGASQAANSPEAKQASLNFIRSSFDKDKILGFILEDFEKRMNPLYAKEIINWYNTPFGKKLLDLEKMQSPSERKKEFEQFAAEHDSQSQSKERMALVERLESLTSASEFGVKLSYVLNFEFIKAMNDAMPPSNREDLSAVEARFDQMKQQQLEMMKKSVQLAFLFSYRTLTDEDLRAYVDFVKTDASQWFVKSVQDSCLSGFKKAVKQLGQKMASLISEQQSQGQ